MVMLCRSVKWLDKCSNKIKNNLYYFFFFNDTATTEIYTLSLHDALPIFMPSAPSATISSAAGSFAGIVGEQAGAYAVTSPSDRKSTRLNSSHSQISYAVFCLKKKKK